MVPECSISYMEQMCSSLFQMLLTRTYGANVQQFVSDAYDKDKLLPKTANHVSSGLLDLISSIIQSSQLVSVIQRCSTLHINYIGSGQS